MTMKEGVTMTISDLAVRIDEAGIDAVVPALRAESEQLAEIARRAHLSDALTDTLTSDRVGDIMWLRAFCRVRDELTRLHVSFELAA
ncbi:MAG: hypothetical protein KDB63_22545 [Nocardioidaceae bacterium]|jgi:hypothetical protein|nr:hypothetical protein [Nocardioidaceae bacterium]